MKLRKQDSDTLTAIAANAALTPDAGKPIPFNAGIADVMTGMMYVVAGGTVRAVNAASVFPVLDKLAAYAATTGRAVADMQTRIAKAKGEIGPMPAHEWRGTELRFEIAPGTWGAFVDLKGERGDSGGAFTAMGFPIVAGGGSSVNSWTPAGW